MIRVIEVYRDVDPDAVGSVIEDAGRLPPRLHLHHSQWKPGRVGHPHARCDAPAQELADTAVATLSYVPAVVALAAHHGTDGATGLGGTGGAGGVGPQAAVERMVLNTATTAYDTAHLNEEARDSTTTDPLTGLPNRRHFIEQATVKADSALPTDRPVSAAVLDVDLETIMKFSC
ncbi:hypothetical protein [Parafrankia sp. EUN1f]|uniref:GGDEF domain-containing protein n=1 Tax=Parafrankia sp. EUN1f TaxID=102897 RepID=UPI0001C443A7|nr:hypothetical protein [Parafrankia sp. EUN1f]EFC82512.1 response regulator receiver protein [Parafrankia sp. EUN1f]